MIILPLLALAMLQASSPPPSDEKALDAACLVVMAAAAKLPPPPEMKPTPQEQREIEEAGYVAKSFYMGRLSALDPHTNWTKFVSERVNGITSDQAVKGVPACIARSVRLQFGDDPILSRP